MDIWNGAEITILERIQEIFSCAFLDSVMPYITRFADSGIGWIVLALLLLIPRKTRRTGAAMGVALLLGFLTGNLLHRAHQTVPLGSDDLAAYRETVRVFVSVRPHARVF